MLTHRHGLPAQRPATTGHWSHFLVHLIEMTVAMLVGMAAAVPVLWAIFALLGVHSSADAFARYPVLICLVVAAGMSTMMVAWMRHRGHTWERCAEMTGAMLVPLIPIFALVGAGVLAGSAACGWYCLAMVPAMLVAMLLRRRDYSGHPARA
jgi:hypothetical protein